jgi:hypothetical protein
VDQKNEPPASAARWAAVVFLFLFCAGATLRILLCWVNPPQNAFDNHYEPIFLIMQTGAIPEGRLFPVLSSASLLLDLGNYR